MKTQQERGLFKHKYSKSKIAVTGVATFLATFAFVYCSSVAFLGAGESNASTTIHASVSASGYYAEVSSAGQVDINVNSTLTGSTAYATDTLSVRTNSTGFQVYLSTADATADSQNLYLDGSSTYFIGPTSALAASPATGLDANTWGFSLDGGTTYAQVPTRGNDVLVGKAENLTAGVETTHDVNVTYGVKADLSLPAGSYSGTVLYSIVADAAVDATAASVAPNRMDTSRTGTFDMTVTTPVITSMSQLGSWTIRIGTTECSNVTTSIVNNVLVLHCDAPKNIPAGTYTVTATDTRYGTYTAVDAITYSSDDIFSISTMQEMTAAVCDATPTPSKSATDTSSDRATITASVDAVSGLAGTVPEITLTDTRDGREYLIRKLADGNCWMAQNLELNLSTATALTSDDSDISTSRGSWTPNNSTQTTSGTAWAQADNNARSYSPQNETNQCINAANSATADCSTLTATQQHTNRIGNYYNWYAATAGTGLASLTNTSVDESICPKGWTLPIGGDVTTNKSFKYLLVSIYGVQTSSDTNLLTSPLNFIRGGTYAYNTGALNGRSTAGHYWSSTAADTATNSYRLNFGNSVYPGTNYASKGNGLSLRCVSR